MGKEVNLWAEELGNHRARILASEKADAVRVHIPWRRRDVEPENKDIVIIDASNGERVKNFIRANVNRGFGDIVFQA